ncbi:MAG: TolC family protein [Kiritimatiellia bacterium]
MFRRHQLFLVACAALAVLVGCETVGRARSAQDEIASATNDVPVAVSARARVNLLGCDLYDYAAFALTNRPSLESARLAVSNAALALKSVTADRALQASLAGGYSQSTANGGSHFSWHQNRGKGTAEVSFDLLICDFGRIDARELEARENLVAARRDLADGEYDVFNEVAQAYFALLRNDALLEVARTNEFMYAEHLRQSESLFAAGEAKKLDVLKARVDLSDARLATIGASNDVLTAGAEFLRALGLESDRAAREDVLAVAENALEVSRRALPETRYDAVEGLQIARTNAPSLMALRARLRAASARVDYAVADLLPELTLSSAFSFADPAWNWSWGFRAVQTLLDGFRKQTAVDAAVVEMQSARTEVEAAEQRLSYDLSVAAAARDNARQSLETATVEVEQAKENFDNVTMQYRVGDASRLDFTDAASALASALGARVKAFYTGEAAEATLIRLTGRVPPYGGRARTTGTHREVNDNEMD